MEINMPLTRGVAVRRGLAAAYPPVGGWRDGAARAIVVISL